MTCPCSACAAIAAKPVPPGKCPVCRTADLTHGREMCQACGAVRKLNDNERKRS